MNAFERNRRSLLKISGAGAAVALAPSVSLARTTPAWKSASRPSADQQLEGVWQFRQVGTEAWQAASVPGTVHTDLLANKSIADPFYRTNERDQQWIDKEDWEYRTEFDLNAATLIDEHIELVFAGLDTYAEVYVNNVRVLQADNMFREWTVDIKSHARVGKNILRIVFTSPIQKGLAQLAAFGFNPPATNDQSENGGLGDKKVSPFTRKAGYHYGWDWGPRFVTSGIWRPVYLRAWSSARIQDVHIVQDELTTDLASLTAVIEVIATKPGKGLVAISSVDDPRIKATVEVVLTEGLNTIKVPVIIGHPKLWWSNGLGEAFLYALSARLVALGVDETRVVKTGLRTLIVQQKPDPDGKSFYVELNGMPVFMKGANYIPNDSFLPRVTAGDLERVVRSAADTHMNMLRVWGGGVYEDDRFYDLCDEHGILVWHDFMFACSMYPDDQAFLDNVMAEAVQNVRRLRNHPSIALWCGNNEMDSAWQNDVPNGGWGWKQNFTQEQRERLWHSYSAIFLDILPGVVAAHDSQRFYLSSSPLAADGKHADLKSDKQSGDIHYWDVWWGQRPFADYRTHIGRFMSEYGFQSFPDFATVDTYTEPGDWDIFSEVMQAHQRSSIGNQTIKTYMERDYRVPDDFKQFLYVGQVLQAEGIKVAMEAHRARMPYCMGSLFWQINDCWPVASWSSIDYYGRWKAQQYFARKAYAPVLISPVLENGLVTMTLVSDMPTARSVNLTIEVLDFMGGPISRLTQLIEMGGNSASVCFTADEASLLQHHAAESVVLIATISEGAKILSENTLYFRPVKVLALPRPEIHQAISKIGKDYAVALTATALVKNLYLTVEGDSGQFDDNYFDLLPGRTVIVRYREAKVASINAFSSKLRWTHIAET